MFFPRLMLIKVEYPQLVAVSGGMWLILTSGKKYQAGPVTELQIGLSGVTYTLGAGLTSALNDSYEHVSAFGLEGVFHRTWPWWSPWLPTSTSYAGVQAFAHFFAFRCSAGVMWNVSNTEMSHAIPMGGCGIGLP
jgi:hypothetical protein